MSENAKTLTFLAAAAVIVVAALLVSRPAAINTSAEDLQGQPLYPDFNDPLAVTSLDIIEFDEDSGAVRPFQVAQIDVKGKTRWVIPSHDDYPADAKDQVASAAASMMGLQIIESVSDNQGDRREYGVVEPDTQKLRLGDTGVGEQVIMKGKDGTKLLDLVIGKEVPDRPELRYVRKAGEDGIYVVALNTEKLSTRFEDWIERNLLQINSFDISRLWIRDYAIKAMRQGLAIIQRGELELAHNNLSEWRWRMLKDRKFVSDDGSNEGGHWDTIKMAKDEELDMAKLQDLLYALDDLKIVDVSRKPKGVSAELKASADFTKKSDAAMQSLAAKGFYIAQLGEEIELFSNEGEIRVGGQDGVEYVLRFGDIAGAGDVKKDDKDKDKEKPASSPGLNRYLFIMAEFNASLIPEPKYEPLPPAKKESEEKPAAKEEGTKKDGDKKDAEKKPADKTEAAEKKPVEDPRAAVEKENKRRKEEYQSKLDEGRKRVKELNARFADWYYIISDDVYRKIHLTRGEIVKKIPPKKEPKTDVHADQ